MCRESVSLDTSNKSEVHARAGAARRRSAEGSLLRGGHIQLGGPPSCAGGNTFMTMYPELFHDDRSEKNSHNSLLDINDLWHLRWKLSLQLRSHTADLQGCISAGWIMLNMKDTKLQFKMSLSFSRKHDLYTVSLYALEFKGQLIVSIHRSIPILPCRGQCLSENQQLKKPVHPVLWYTTANTVKIFI